MQLQACSTSSCSFSQAAPLHLPHEFGRPAALPGRLTAGIGPGARRPVHRLQHSAAAGLAQSGGAFGSGHHLADCPPGTSRAVWAEPSQPGPSNGRTGSQTTAAASAAALAEPPAPATAAAEGEEPAVTRIFSGEELDEHVHSHGSDLVVLMCKAHSCRPCKMFSRKFERLSRAYPSTTFLEIFGDDSKETRALMISLSIRVTPTFRLYRNGDCVHELSGINETNLRNAVEAH